MGWTITERQLDGRITLFQVRNAQGVRVTWDELLDGWHSPDFAASLSSTLAARPSLAFRWECPALGSHNRDSPCEFVTVDDPSLDRAAAKDAFAMYLGAGPIVTFTNLGGDATLVVPRDVDEGANYAHLASFLRGAPAAQQLALWSSVSNALAERLSSTPVWLSTAGRGVPWLHVRLDDRPKYYAHSPYRAL